MGALMQISKYIFVKCKFDADISVIYLQSGGSDALVQKEKGNQSKERNQSFLEYQIEGRVLEKDMNYANCVVKIKLI